MKHDCGLCEKYYASSRNLKLHINSIDHMKRIHGIQDTSKCNICSREILKNHFMKLIHEGNKDYKCESCGKLFMYNNSSYLKKHIQTIHEGQKDFKCNYCGNLFKSIPKY